MLRFVAMESDPLVVDFRETESSICFYFCRVELSKIK